MKPLFIAALIVHIQQISSADLLSGHTVSLYNATDKITVLNGQSFSSIVYQSDTAWLVEFYANWCGHCQSYVAV
jgi:thiol-disulfide isomerase/thioredoxin